MSSSLRLPVVVKARDPKRLSATFHMVNRLLPASQVVLTVAPEIPARDALALMREHGYSQVPVVQGKTVLGLFSFRAFALESLSETLGAQNLADLPVEEFLEHEAALYARLTDEFRGLIDVLDLNDCVLVSGPNELIAVVTPMDVLRYLHRVANVFVLIEEIELSLRTVFRTALADPAALQTALANALSSKYGGEVPGTLERLTFDDYISVVRDGRNWPRFQDILGGTRERVRAKLEPIRELRNDVFHFKRELTVEDHERLAACRDWLLRCVLKIEARGWDA